MLTIVMYHYIRDGAGLRGRTPEELERQLDHVAAHYTVLGCEDVARGGWPEDACLLTFDDGLVEHGEVVAPALERRELTGVFCVPAKSVLERCVLDVQKSQLLLVAVPDHAALGDRIVELAELRDEEAFRARTTPRHRFDPPETVFVKRALQDGLPEERRRMVLDRLFREHVTEDEHAVADALYLTLESCRELVHRGHDVIGHGNEHRRLALLDETEQRAEIERTREFITAIGGTWALSFPYGSRNETTLRILDEHDCLLGLTTEPRRATEDDPLLELPRIDTNDLQLEIVERGGLNGPFAEST